MIHAFLPVPDCSGTGPCSILYHKLEILHAVYYQQSPVHTLASKSNSMPTSIKSPVDYDANAASKSKCHFESSTSRPLRTVED